MSPISQRLSPVSNGLGLQNRLHWMSSANSNPNRNINKAKNQIEMVNAMIRGVNHADSQQNQSQTNSINKINLHGNIKIMSSNGQSPFAEYTLSQRDHYY